MIPRCPLASINRSITQNLKFDFPRSFDWCILNETYTIYYKIHIYFNIFISFLSFFFCSLVASISVARIKFPNLKSWLLRKERRLTPHSGRTSIRERRLSWLSLNTIKWTGRAKSVTFIGNVPLGELKFLQLATLTEITVTHICSFTPTNMKTSVCEQ